MSESQLNKHFKSILDDHTVMQRVEPSLANINFPDWYITLKTNKILVEAKHIREWPKRPQTGIRFKRYTPGQKQFIHKHGKFGKGGVFILLQVDDDILLFPWHCAYSIDGATKKKCFEDCIFSWKRSDRRFRSLEFKEELIHVLSTN